MEKKEIVIASKNVHKIREYKEIFKEVLLDFDVLSLLNFPKYIAAKEAFDTFEKNAKQKALHAAKFLNKLVLADDSGLIVPALNGEPGVYSARYAGKDASDIDNRKKLLDKMEGFDEEKRYAYFECYIVVASSAGVEKVSNAICEGFLLTEEKGGCGFGYDPLFVKNGYSKTFSQLDPSLKNKISHRRKAFDKILPFLESLQDEVLN